MGGGEVLSRGVAAKMGDDAEDEWEVMLTQRRDGFVCRMVCVFGGACCVVYVKLIDRRLISAICVVLAETRKNKETG